MIEACDYFLCYGKIIRITGIVWYCRQEKHLWMVETTLRSTESYTSLGNT